MSLETLPIRSTVGSAGSLLRGEARGGEASIPPPPPAPALPNPRMRLDSLLGVVVLEFRDRIGELAHTIPSSRQLAAYRAAVMSDAPLPPGLPMPGTPEIAPAPSPERGEPSAG